MSIVVRFKPANLTAQKYDESTPRVEQAGFPPEGLDYHVCFGTDPDHLTVSEIWDSREQMEAWGEKAHADLDRVRDRDGRRAGGLRGSQHHQAGSRPAGSLSRTPGSHNGSPGSVTPLDARHRALGSNEPSPET